MLNAVTCVSALKRVGRVQPLLELSLLERLARGMNRLVLGRWPQVTNGRRILLERFLPQDSIDVVNVLYFNVLKDYVAILIKLRLFLIFLRLLPLLCPLGTLFLLGVNAR